MTFIFSMVASSRPVMKTGVSVAIESLVGSGQQSRRCQLYGGTHLPSSLKTFYRSDLEELKRALGACYYRQIDVLLISSMSDSHVSCGQW